MKIWILTSKFGQGHFSAAKALEKELSAEGHQVVVSDVIALIHPVLHKAIYKVFNKIICRSANLYNFLNEFGRKEKTQEQMGNKRLQQAYMDIQPDMIISTWSACARKLGKVEAPLYVCITDVGTHPGWRNANAAGYFVACDNVRSELMLAGIPSEKIHVLGIPIRDEFYQVIKPAGRQNTIMIMGGGLGILPWIDQVLSQLHRRSNVKITVIAGNNHRLKKHLEKKYPWVKAVGYTDAVYNYLAKADVLISKPGGVSLFESIYTETPCIAMFPQFKHEMKNADFIMEHGLGQVVCHGEQAGERIVELIEDDLWFARSKENIRRFKDELASTRTSIKGYCHAI